VKIRSHIGHTSRFGEAVGELVGDSEPDMTGGIIISNERPNQWPHQYNNHIWQQNNAHIMIRMYILLVPWRGGCTGNCWCQ
jgi:hypothetical protein